jgi:hypothetical protein
MAKVTKHDYTPAFDELEPSFEDFVSRVQYGTPLVVVDAKSKRELYNKRLPYYAPLEHEFSRELIRAELWTVSLTGTALRVEVILPEVRDA